jgi:hypothetical protein
LAMNTQQTPVNSPTRYFFAAAAKFMMPISS